MKPSLLLVGTDSTHTVNYFHLIRDYFSDIKVITTRGEGRWGEIPVVLADMSLKHPTVIPRTIRLFRKKIADFQPDIVHVHQVGTPALYTLWSKPKEIPLVITAWGSDILQKPHVSSLHKAMVKYILRRGDVFTADSRYMAAEMQRLAGRADIEVVVANFGIPRMPVAGPKEKLIYSNRLHKKLYRIDLVLTAFARFVQKAEGEGWKLVVAGSGEETTNLQALADALGIIEKVDFVGFVDSVENLSYYSRAAIYLSLPESDATSISLLEALAACCRPVVSNLPSNLEWIDDGINGIVVDDLEKDFISDALKLDYKRLVQINTALAQDKASREANRQKFCSIYDKLLNR